VINGLSRLTAASEGQVPPPSPTPTPATPPVQRTNSVGIGVPQTNACPKCAAILREGSNFCAKCGFRPPIDALQAAQSSSTSSLKIGRQARTTSQPVVVPAVSVSVSVVPAPPAPDVDATVELTPFAQPEEAKPRKLSFSATAAAAPNDAPM